MSVVQFAAINLEAAHVERAALETERFLGVHLQRDGGQSFRFETLLDAAREIAEHFDVLEYGERDAVFGQGGPQPPHVAKQVLILPVAAEYPPWPRRFGCARRRRSVRAELRRGELWQGEGSGVGQARRVRRDGPGGGRSRLSWSRPRV